MPIVKSKQNTKTQDYLFARQIYTELPSADSPSPNQIPRTAGAGPGLEPRTPSDSPMWVAGIQLLESSHLPPPRVCATKKLELGVIPRLEPRHSSLGCGDHRQCLHPRQTTASPGTFQLVIQMSWLKEGSRRRQYRMAGLRPCIPLRAELGKKSVVL